MSTQPADMSGARVWLVITHGHSIRGIYTTKDGAMRHAAPLRELGPDVGVEVYEVATNTALHTKHADRSAQICANRSANDGGGS